MPTKAKNTPIPKRDEKEKLKIHELAISELRTTYNRLDSLYDNRRSITFLFLGGGFGLLGYLFSEKNFTNKILSLEPYGVIFFFLGLGTLIVSLISLYIVTRPVLWSVPTENKDLKRINKYYSTYLGFLEYLLEEYIHSLEKNGKHHEVKQQYFNFGSISLIISAVVLIVIKEFS